MELIFGKIKDLDPELTFGYFQLRSEIFVLEQQCVYLDMDDQDLDALHVIGVIDGEVVAGARILEGESGVHIGRVVVHQKARGNGLGKDLMQQTMFYVDQKFNRPAIEISAQMYLNKFYSSLGFKNVGKEYLEDGLPHIEMVRAV